MQINPAPELRTQAIQALKDEYGIDKNRPGLHQSELSYCLTKSYWNKTDYIPPDDHAAVMFGIGFAMERVMLERDHPDPIEIDGITMSLDSLKAFGIPIDLKTTRLASEKSNGCGLCGEPYKGHSWVKNGHKYVTGEKTPFELPKGWVRQAMAYGYALNRVSHHPRIGSIILTSNELRAECAHCSAIVKKDGEAWVLLSPILTFSFVVVHLVEADITAHTITFTPQELEDNWQRLLTRKMWLEKMLEDENPNPFQSNEDWECEGCVDSIHQCQLAFLHHAVEELTLRDLGEQGIVVHAIVTQGFDSLAGEVCLGHAGGELDSNLLGGRTGARLDLLTGTCRAQLVEAGRDLGVLLILGVGEGLEAVEHIADELSLRLPEVDAMLEAAGYHVANGRVVHLVRLGFVYPNPVHVRGLVVRIELAVDGLYLDPDSGVGEGLAVRRRLLKLADLAGEGAFEVSQRVALAQESGDAVGSLCCLDCFLVGDSHESVADVVGH